MRNIIIILSVIVMAAIIFCYCSFSKFARGVKDDLKTHYPVEVKLNDSITLLVKQPGSVDTIRTR